ncbi:MAG: hypothetical protein ACJ74J_06110 [Blastocatellia bacterium]
MQDSTEEIARRVLESVLRRLDDGATRPATAQSSNQNGMGNSPVIVIMLGDQRATKDSLSATTSQNIASPIVVNQPACGCQNNSHASARNSLQSPHPGLQRFDLPTENVVSDAPRMCFMEPGRACVSSGACEMRGY